MVLTQKYQSFQLKYNFLFLLLEYCNIRILKIQEQDMRNKDSSQGYRYVDEDF